MKPILLKKDNSSVRFLYAQLYEELKNQILHGEITSGEKLLSVREMALHSGSSVTTVSAAYNQLVSEGYIESIPGSGFYAQKIHSVESAENDHKGTPKIREVKGEDAFYVAKEDKTRTAKRAPYLYDSEAFDFIKWKKCAANILTEKNNELLFPSELKGEFSLRHEICNYLLRSRGVKASPTDVIIAAGTQQVAYHLVRIFKSLGIGLLSLEKPGFAPVKSMIKDAGIEILDIPVTQNGIDIGKLPTNVFSAVYVNPSNQFPTGAVMPVNERRQLLSWAVDNNSFIIEDDYNSELRYFGKPLPTLKSLDNLSNERVIYLGSFSSTLFGAIKISYMVLPAALSPFFDSAAGNYTQTCSKAEQLTLARYMEEGFYYTAIKKKRVLYSKKLEKIIEIFNKTASKEITLNNANSGLTVIVKAVTPESPEKFLEDASKLQIRAEYINDISSPGELYFSLYYAYIPLSEISVRIPKLLRAWSKCEPD